MMTVALAFPDTAADMDLQILQGAGQIVHNRHSDRLQQWTRSDARQLQDLRRIDGATCSWSSVRWKYASTSYDHPVLPRRRLRSNSWRWPRI